jgi:hypothetical protein
VLFPEAVERICVVCGSARTSEHNRVFLQGVIAALTADPAYRDRVRERLAATVVGHSDLGAAVSRLSWLACRVRPMRTEDHSGPRRVR